MVKNKSSKNENSKKVASHEGNRQTANSSAEIELSGSSDLCKRLSSLSVNFRKEGKTNTKHPPCIPRRAFPPEHSLTVMQEDSSNVIPYLQDVLSDIRIDVDRKREKRQLINNLIKEKMMNGLKRQCEIFNYLFREVAFVGSFYEGLKITDADEFDLNILLKLPFGTTTPYEVGEIKRAPGHMFLKWDPAHLNRIKQGMDAKLRPILKWVDEDGYLLVKKVNQYWESLIARYMADEGLELLYEVNDISWSKNGPAITLYFDEVAVDLVPTFAFSWKDSPPPHIKNPQVILPDHKNLRWFIVPKPLKDKGCERAWRLSFSEHEREMIHDFGWIKPAIKIVKRLRDRLNWKIPDSFSIKTVALWQIECGYLSEKDKVDTAFEKLLRGLMYFLEDGYLPLFWDFRLNKFEELKCADGLSKSKFLSKNLQTCEEIIDLCIMISG